YGQGQLDPSNACRVCDTATSRTAFSPNDGARCDDGLFCTDNDTCAAGACAGAPRSCDDGVSCNGTESCNETAGRCDAGTTTCGADEVCDASADACVPSCTGCVIGGVCYGEGQLDPSNPCRVCRRATSATAFSANDGASCDDGLFCTVADTCSAGACSGSARDCSDGVACTGVESCDETADRCAAGTPTCASGRVCNAATDTCVLTCASGTVPCGSVCTSTNNDPSNCGGCGMVCPGGPGATAVCAAGACRLLCDADRLDCTASAGCETDALTDRNHCGFCGNACTVGQSCDAGRCVGPSVLRNPISGSNSSDFTRGSIYNGVSVDPTNGRVYWWPSYLGSAITEYTSVANFIANTGGRTINLPVGYDGTYHAALNGLLYYNESATNNIVAVRASDAALVSRVPLAGAGFRNQSHWNWGGYSDICLYTDVGGALYAIWAPPAGNITVSRLDPSTLAVLQSRTIPRVKISSGFGFVAAGRVYIGQTYNQPNIVGVLDFASGVYDAAYTNSLTPVSGDYVAFVMWEPASNTLFEVTNTHVLIYPSALQ
ncbi:MAG: hypothetical protein K8H88_05535, partial [Sandaracinaceae bacterium]|nr:hypothetical protein [Sandaracinaceae bacterium]